MVCEGVRLRQEGKGAPSQAGAMDASARRLSKRLVGVPTLSALVLMSPSQCAVLFWVETTPMRHAGFNSRNEAVRRRYAHTLPKKKIRSGRRHRAGGRSLVECGCAERVVGVEERRARGKGWSRAEGIVCRLE